MVIIIIIQYKEENYLEQLTQMELLQLHELLGAEELTLKKCLVYANQINNDELQPFVQESISLHKQNLATLIDLFRQHNGKGGVTQ
jgi:hypothetical protein